MEDQNEDVWAVLADAFSSLDQVEDDVRLDVKEQFHFRAPQSDRFPQTPLHESKQYLAFEHAADELFNDRIDKPTFLERVGQLSQQQRRILHSLESPKVERRYAGLSADENRLYHEIRRCFGRLCEGAELMLSFRTTDNPEVVRQGIGVLAEAFVDLDLAQEEVVELGQRRG
ncbi:MAG: hypothetical protein AB7S38_00825 [Vulcanimicrobiota bacterium]